MENNFSIWLLLLGKLSDACWLFATLDCLNLLHYWLTNAVNGWSWKRALKVISSKYPAPLKQVTQELVQIPGEDPWRSLKGLELLDLLTNAWNNTILLYFSMLHFFSVLKDYVHPWKWVKRDRSPQDNLGAWLELKNFSNVSYFLF